MKNIHILPTTPNDETAKGIWIKETRDWCNIYITSDEEIKPNVYALINGVLCKTELLDGRIVSRQLTGGATMDICKSEYSEIILTTDQDLIADGIQAIDDEFLEWFVKNPSCEEVEFKSEYLGSKCLKCGFIENHDEVDTEDCPKCHNTTYDHLYNQYKIMC